MLRTITIDTEKIAKSMVDSTVRHLALSKEDKQEIIKDKVKADEEKWLPESYHSSYDQAIYHIVSKDILVDDDKVNSIGDYLDEVRRVKDLLRDITHVTDEKVATLKESKSKNIKL